MKQIHKLVKNRKSNKIATVAKIAIPVVGAVATKYLWDKKGSQALDKARSTVLHKTEDVQEKVQKFHDFLQNSIDERHEDIYEEETVIDAEIVEDDISVQATEGEEDGNNEETMEETAEIQEEIITKTEESTTEIENN